MIEKITKNFHSRIAFRLVKLIIMALILSAVVFISWARFMDLYLEKSIRLPSDEITRIDTFFSLGLNILPIITFISIFLLGINKRVSYLKYISKRVMEFEKETHLEELELRGNDEITELANSFNIMSNRLKENYEKEKKIEQAKRELIAAVSHDLKTPLTSIIGYLEIMNQYKGINREKEVEYLKIVYEKSISLKNLIDELFEYTKLANDYIVLEKVPFNIAILVNQIVGEHLPFLEHKNISVTIECQAQELWSEIDVTKMKRVLENIVKNAEKYSFDNTKFKVTMAEIDENIEIIFENVGEHINSEEIERIFDKMYRLDKARNLDNEGSGLGLAISKKIVELHEGKLWAECEGNTIKFHIILQKA